MSTREELLTHLWQRVINANLDPATIHHLVASHQATPNEPFADTGAAINRLLALGAQISDLCLIRREASYVAVFQTLYALDDPGVDDDEVFMPHEELLGADPTGTEGLQKAWLRHSISCPVETRFAHSFWRVNCQRFFDPIREYQ